MGIMSILRSRKFIATMHIVIFLAVLASIKLDIVGVSPAVILCCLALLALMLIYYIILYAIKLTYIPKFDLYVALCLILVWVFLLFTSPYWSNLDGWAIFIHYACPLTMVLFFLCLIIINLIVYLINPSFL